MYILLSIHDVIQQTETKPMPSTECYRRSHEHLTKDCERAAFAIRYDYQVESMLK